MWPIEKNNTAMQTSANKNTVLIYLYSIDTVLGIIPKSKDGLKCLG